MRQFILAKDVDYATQLDYSTIAKGAIGVFNIINGKNTSVSDGTEITDMCNLVVGGDSTIGATVFPIFKNHFSYVKSEYRAATFFKAEFTLTDANNLKSNTIIIIKKGIGFNERSKWTIDEFTTESDTIITLENKFIKQINKGTLSHGINATGNGAGKITLTAVNKGEDYTVILTEALSGIKVTETRPTLPINDTKDIINMFSMAAADAGFGGTYSDNIAPGYPINLSDVGPSPEGYDVITIRFAEPRMTVTVDEVVHQIIQIAFPAGASGTGITTLETILSNLVTDHG